MSDAIEPTSVQTAAEAAAQPGNNLPATTSSNPPEQRQSFGQLIFGIVNFIALAACFAALAAAAALLKERLHLLKAQMHRDAAFARKVGEMCGAAGADPYFIALYLETAASFERVADASGELASAADQMEANAQFVKDAHDTEYRGIYEVRQASPYDQPRPGFNRVL
ncbi:MAG: conjugal transfer protein TraB [Streptomyces sp.]|jgi:hypothetical protein|nr:conjugal transfer protein TraB [Streptomyces sp.]